MDPPMDPPYADSQNHASTTMCLSSTSLCVRSSFFARRNIVFYVGARRPHQPLQT